MREIRLSGSEGGGAELNRLSLPLSQVGRVGPTRPGQSRRCRISPGALEPSAPTPVGRVGPTRPGQSRWHGGSPVRGRAARAYFWRASRSLTGRG